MWFQLGMWLAYLPSTWSLKLSAKSWSLWLGILLYSLRGLGKCLIDHVGPGTIHGLSVQSVDPWFVQGNPCVCASLDPLVREKSLIGYSQENPNFAMGMY